MTMPSSRDFRPQTKPALLKGKKRQADKPSAEPQKPGKRHPPVDEC
jgi:hypothetical protein